MAVRTKIRPGTTTISTNTAARARDPSEHSNGVSVEGGMKHERRSLPLTPGTSRCSRGGVVKARGRGLLTKQASLRNAIDDKGRRLRCGLGRPVYRFLTGAVGHNKNVVGEQFLVGLSSLKNLAQ